jgi:hypothetical protein
MHKMTKLLQLMLMLEIVPPVISAIGSITNLDPYDNLGGDGAQG